MKNTFKQNLLILFALFYFQNFYGQSGSEDGLSLPIVSPLAPNASDLGKYGEIQVNESTGLISPSIPLFDYNAGNIIIPIALNYSGNGVRVNQDPTWVGVNWNCNPGGVITREVRDIPDEQTNDRLYFSESEMNLWPGANTTSSTSVWHNTLNGIATGGLIDSEVDIFNYNFFGYSGSFYLDATNNVHLLKYDKELKIIFYVTTTNESSFLITTPDGDSYWFGGRGASESSKFYVNNGAGSSSMGQYAQNAFYLTKISLLNGGVVNYEYDSYFNGGVQPILIGYQETYEKSDVQGSPCVQFKRDLNFQLERFVRLKKISSSMNRQYVEFNGVNINTKLGITKLNNIVLKTENDQIQKKIVLDYLTIDNENSSDLNKFFLTKVNFINSENQFMYKYQMAYNEPEGLPSKLSYAQDELGYFNGEIQNTTLLPLTSYPILNLNCINFGNRKANLGFALKGSLTSITYPTGGRSEFEYELPVIENLATEFVTSHYRVFYREPDYDSSSPLTYTPTSSENPTQFEYHYKQTILANGDGPLVITEPTTIRMRLNIRCMGTYTDHKNVTVQAIKNRIGFPSIIYQTVTISLGSSTETNNDTIIERQCEFNNLPLGSYDFILSLNLSSANHNSQQRFIVNAEFDFPMENQNETYYPGLRIKKIQNYSNNSLPTTTRYFYSTIDNEETFQFFPNYVNVTRVLDRSTLNFQNSYRLNANSLKNNFRGGSPFCIYKNVNISYGGDNYENGGKSLIFSNPINTGARSYASIGEPIQAVPATSLMNLGMIVPPETDITSGDLNLYINGSTNETNLNSVLLEETILSGGIRPKPIKKTNYYYTEELQHVMHNIQPYLFCGLTKGYLFMLYDTKSSKCRLTSTKTEEYFGIRDTVSTLVNRTFSADKVSLPKSIETISSGSDAKKTNLFYPSDVANIPNLNGPDISTLNILQNSKHNVAQIVRTENYVNNVITDAKQISFYDFDNKILPKIISSSKTNQVLENRVLFEDYSRFGKPTLVSLSNGTKTKYIYNDLDQLVLKIENFNSINDNLIQNTPCFYQEMYPNSLITKYDYDPYTHNLVKITDPKCDYFTYSYDAFGRLQSVKDKSGNILSENQYNYKQ